MLICQLTGVVGDMQQVLARLLASLWLQHPWYLQCHGLPEAGSMSSVADTILYESDFDHLQPCKQAPGFLHAML